MAKYRGEVPGSRFDDADDDLPPQGASVQAPRLRRRTHGAEGGGRGETMRQIVRDIPNFVKLLYRLARDPRVSKVDKALVLGAVAYIVSPIDLIPEAVAPFIGQIDDIYLLALVLDRLLNNAGIEVLLDHWDGEVSSLEAAIDALDKAGSFLPERVRNLLHQRVR